MNTGNKMRESILSFPEQFTFAPEIKNIQSFKRLDRYIVVGMGGSHLAAGILKAWKPRIPLIIHRDYGLPELSDEELKNHTIVLISYSGNTEEVIDSLKHAIKLDLNVIAVSTGGELLEYARKHELPHVELPKTNIQPRLALGYMLRALLLLVGGDTLLCETDALSRELKPELLEPRGKELALSLNKRIPIIYASRKNESIAYNWKIKCNETGKIPAFWNVFPELNHNEMNGFDRQKTTKDLSAQFAFIFIKDPQDHPRIKRRMEILEAQYKERNFPVTALLLRGESFLGALFSNLLLADWTAFYIAEEYNVEPEKVPMVEEFKKRIKNTE